MFQFHIIGRSIKRCISKQAVCNWSMLLIQDKEGDNPSPLECRCVQPSHYGSRHQCPPRPLTPDPTAFSVPAPVSCMVIPVSYRQRLHWGEGAGELLQGAGGGPERSRGGEWEDHGFFLAGSDARASRSFDFHRFLVVVVIDENGLCVVCRCVCLYVCVSPRTPLTPHSEKGWRSSCRTLTRTKMAALKCPR